MVAGCGAGPSEVPGHFGGGRQKGWTGTPAPPARKLGAHSITHPAAVAQSEDATTPRPNASATIATRAASTCRDKSSTSRRNGPKSALPTKTTDPAKPDNNDDAASTPARLASIVAAPVIPST